MSTTPVTETTLSLPRGKALESDTVENEVLRLFDLMHHRLLRYALGIGLTPPDGEDIVQETYLALFHHLRLGRPQENLYGWLFRVTHNLALKRRAKRACELDGLVPEDVDDGDPDPDPEASILGRERQLRLQSVLRVLPPADQMCLRLRAEGLPYREIAQIVGISLGSVSASLSRSFNRLQEADRR